MAIHIKNFNIQSYRGIQNLTLENLNSINILTGNNNSGKTSILEILSTVDNPQDIGSWVLPSRTTNSRIRSHSFFNGFSSMFPVDNENKYVSYEFLTSDNIKTQVKLEGELESTQIPEDEMHRLNGLLRTGSSKGESEIIDTTCLHLSTFINNQIVNEYTLYDFQTRISRFVNKKPFFVRTTYVSPVDHATGMLYLDDVLADTQLYEQLLNILQEFDNNIISITSIKTKNAIPEYMVLTKNHHSAIPLNSYGDGMKKALLLLSAIVRSQNGILLLDEFETAIHTSAMDSVFSWLLQSALKLNVQVFLTSHSKEAIDKILKMNDTIQSNINVYTLYNCNGNNYARMLNCLDAINAQDKLGLELR